MNTGKEKNEKSRLIIFMVIISEIQRNFIGEYGLFVRGGLTIGNISFNDDYVFGEGLIDVVGIEESTKQPRICISEKIINFYINNKLYSNEEADRALLIEDRIKNNEELSYEESEFYQKMLNLANQELFIRKIGDNLFYKSEDNVSCLSYLYCISINSLVEKVETIKMIRQYVLTEYGIELPELPNIDSYLLCHKQKVEEKIRKYSNYTNIDTNNLKRFDAQEEILRKYVWVMVYHNYMCNFYNKPQFHINTIANCEKRHMKLVIFVTDGEGNIIL